MFIAAFHNINLGRGHDNVVNDSLRGKGLGYESGTIVFSYIR